MSKFGFCLDIVLAFEGGYVNHPADPGGATNMGITIGTLSEYLGRQATVDDVKNISRETVEKIYRERYWDKMRCDEIPHPIDLIIFDYAVMAGLGNCSEIVQEIVGAKVDGVLGPKTLAKLRSYLEDYGMYAFVIAFRSKKMHRLESLRHWGTFGRGWTNRNRKVMGIALDRITGEQ